MGSNKFGIWLAGALAAVSMTAWAGPAEQLFDGAWDWHLPPRKFGKLSQAERVQYTRAEGLIKDGQYEAAGLEFEKFVTAYPKSDAYGQALLMQGYSYHLGKFRNKAIERYNEVIDFFGDAPDVVVPAGFLKGMALIENGNTDQGYAVFQEMTDKDGNLENPLSDLALSRLADHYFAANDPRKAERCWLRVVEAYQNAFFGRPEATAVGSRQKLTELYCREGKFSSVDELYERFPLASKKKSDNGNYIVERGLAIFDSIPDKPRKAFFDWLRSRKADYEGEGRELDWYSRLMTIALKAGFRSEWGDVAGEAVAFFMNRTGSDVVAAAANMLAGRLSEADNAGFKLPKEWKAFGTALTAQCDKQDAAGQMAVATAMLNGFSARLASNADVEAQWNAMIARCRDLYVKKLNPEKDEGLASLVDRLRNARQFDRATELVRRIENPGLAMWKEIEVLGAQEKFVPEAAKCEELEQLNDPVFSTRALRLRAQLYKDRLAKYEEAVKLYAMLNDPPGSIWNTVDCYQRWGKPDNAISSLTEIENFFPNDAPNAALRKAQIWENVGDKTKTVAALRAVLKKYPKHQVASQAHQMLERYGVATGGGVIDEE
jgi:tetratricopeptide (TPR) repeat protein